MSLTYAIGDIHGRLDLLRLLLAEIEDDTRGGTVVFLGDYVDRGPDSKGVLDLLMAGPKDPKRWVWRVLKGNHEDMMDEGLKYPMKFSNAGGLWLANGGHETLVSFGDADVEPYRRWIRQLPLMWRDRHRVYTHAGVDPTKRLNEQTDHFVLWNQIRTGHPEAYVVHGHIPDERGPIQGDGWIDMDCYAFKSGKLAAAVFYDDVVDGPVDMLRVRI